MDTLLSRIALTAGTVLGLLLTGWLVLSDPIGRGCATVRDTVVVARIDTFRTAPDTIYIHARHVVRDTLYKSRVDSLVATVANKDSIIRTLAEIKKGQQPFSLKAKTTSGDSLNVTGLALIECRPLDDIHHLILTPDPIYLKARDTTITITQVVEVLEPKSIAISIFGGMLCGAGLMWYILQ